MQYKVTRSLSIRFNSLTPLISRGTESLAAQCGESCGDRCDQGGAIHLRATFSGYSRVEKDHSRGIESERPGRKACRLPGPKWIRLCCCPVGHLGCWRRLCAPLYVFEPLTAVRLLTSNADQRYNSPGQGIALHDRRLGPILGHSAPCIRQVQGAAT